MLRACSVFLVLVWGFQGFAQTAGFPLQVAARAGDAATLTRLLTAGAAVDQVDEGGNTALISAAYHGRTEAVRLLLAHGADPARHAASGYAALDYAMERGHREVVIGLIRHWRSAAGKEGKAEEAASLGLVLAAAEGREPELKKHLKVRTSVNLPNRSGCLPLAMAARWGWMPGVTRLLAAGAKVEAATRTRYATTALMEATRDGHVDVAQALLAAGAPVNQPDRHGDHALNWATYFGHGPLVSLLVAAGSRLDVTGQTDDTAIEIAVREKHGAVVDILRAAGAVPRKKVS